MDIGYWEYGDIRCWEYRDIQYWEYEDIQDWGYEDIYYLEYGDIQYWEYKDIEYWRAKQPTGPVGVQLGPLVILQPAKYEEGLMLQKFKRVLIEWFKPSEYVI